MEKKIRLCFMTLDLSRVVCYCTEPAGAPTHSGMIYDTVQSTMKNMLYMYDQSHVWVLYFANTDPIFLFFFDPNKKFSCNKMLIFLVLQHAMILYCLNFSDLYRFY